jgi:sortase A
MKRASSETNVRSDSAIVPKDKRQPLTLRALGTRFLLVLGLVMLATYVVARIHASILSRVAVRQFEELKKPPPGSASSTGAGSTESPQTTSEPDFVLWSKERIRGFQDSLKLRLAPPMAVLRIPTLRLEVPLLEGTDDVTLNRGVGRIAGTGHVGEDGNIGIAGHRDGLFRGLKDIKVGDRVELEGLERTDTYVVDQLQFVSPNDVSVLRPRPIPSLTLVTCYPFYFIGSAPQRYIVHASRKDFESPKDHVTEQSSQSTR